MDFRISLFLMLASLPAILAQIATHGRVIVDGAVVVAQTDDNYICATIDWWPHDKCNYNRCPWGYSSATNLNLSHPLLIKAIQAFEHLRIRIGGSLQDQVLYDVGSLKTPCHPFQKVQSGLFGFSKGCLHMSRWDDLNQLFKTTGAIVTFGLNALHGRHQIQRDRWGGEWDSANARDFMNYTISKGYVVDSWEFGNELSGHGVGASVDVELYAKDVIKLRDIINELYKNSDSKPSLVAPGGFFEQEWYAKLLQVSGSNVVNVITHHIYNLGAGIDPHLTNNILDPHYLSRVSEIFNRLDQTIQVHGPWASAWVGESGGAYNSGGRHVSNTFINSFWYLDQLGLASKYDTKVYCRQTLIGGHYGLLNTSTFVPNPDFYSALLWDRLMGKTVLPVGSDASSFLRAYAHCSRGSTGVTVLLINLSNQTHFTIHVQNSKNVFLNVQENGVRRENSFMKGMKKTVAWIGNKVSDASVSREEYHLTPKDGYLQSQTMVLNGSPLELTPDGELPSLNPVLRDVNTPIFMIPLSIAFIVFPNFDAPSCL
ncbi:heparanase-like protein 1 [Momordica charantia]|uniref:Heparanase-like protein 1 n=1 Tax=Momordica charantia TaxID=3673 RepID=A0A6J1BYP4_MOMCH|nr:heparanase-like protein 1 [Momordica charantia]